MIHKIEYNKATKEQIDSLRSCAFYNDSNTFIDYLQYLEDKRRHAIKLIKSRRLHHKERLIQVSLSRSLNPENSMYMIRPLIVFDNSFIRSFKEILKISNAMISSIDTISIEINSGILNHNQFYVTIPESIIVNEDIPTAEIINATYELLSTLFNIYGITTEQRYEL